MRPICDRRPLVGWLGDQARSPPPREHPPRRDRGLRAQRLRRTHPVQLAGRGRPDRGAPGQVDGRHPVEHQGHREGAGQRAPTCSRSAPSASAPTRSTSTPPPTRDRGRFNAPYSNTRSVVELVIGEIIALARRLTEKTARMHDGIWDKSAEGSHEVRGRTLGIVGYGNIGTQLSNLAESLGFRVIFFDKADRLAHGNARRVGTLDELLAQSDVVTLHVDGRPGNAGLFGAAAVREDEAAVDVHQRLARHGRRRRRAARAHPVRPHRRRGPRRLPGRAQGPGRAVRVGPARPAQRDPDPARRRLDPGGAGGDRLLRLRQALQVPPRRQHRAVGQPARGRRAAARDRLPDRAAAPQRPRRPGLGQPVLAEHEANVTAQYLSTRGEQGYVVTDVATRSPERGPRPACAPPTPTIWLRTFPA